MGKLSEAEQREEMLREFNRQAGEEAARQLSSGQLTSSAFIAQQAALNEEIRKAMDEMVRRRVEMEKGVAPGPMMGLDAFLPKQRTFTREEVLAVLKARKALPAPFPDYADVEAAMNHLITIFERME